MLLIDGESEFDYQYDHIVDKIKQVTNNHALIKYIGNSIRKINGILKINSINDDKCDFGFKNQEGSYIYINIDIDNNKIYVYNNNLNCREEVIYDNTYNGVKVQFFGNYRIFGDCGLVVLKNIEEESFYDYNKKFIMSNTHIQHNTCLNGVIMKKLMGTNYDQYVNQCVVGSDIVKIEEFDYRYIPEVNTRKCYVSEYRNGIFSSVNEKNFELPLYKEIIGDFSNYEFKMRSIEKNNAQKQKTML